MDMDSDKDIYKVPEGYFDELEQQLLVKVGIETSASRKRAKLHPLWYVVSGVAASILVLFLWNTEATENMGYDFDYNELVYLHIDEYDFMDVLSEEELSFILNDFSQLSEEDIDVAWEYLEANCNEETIYELL